MARRGTAATPIRTRGPKRSANSKHAASRSPNGLLNSIVPLVDGAPAGIALVDDQGRILSANVQIEKLFGYRRDELVGRPVETLVPLRFRGVHAGHRTAYGADPQAREMGRSRDLMAVRKDGSEFPVEVGLGPLRTEHGLLVAAYVTDLSARKQAEAALRAAQEELEQRVLERTAQLHATNERLAELSNRILTLQEEERRRIGQELHDSSAQTLAAVAMNLTLLERKAGAGLNASAQSALKESVALVEQCAREIRTVAYLLHPPFLDEVGLVAAVRWYAEGFAKRSGISVQVDASPTMGRLPREVETALFRIVQECLTNVHRHSKSSTVRLHLARNPNTITLRVEDSGRGITPDTLQALADSDTRGGMGILGMQERMRHLGGQLDITSGNDGTVVLATLPLSTVQRPPEA